jgi:hypothetical protein
VAPPGNSNDDAIRAAVVIAGRPPYAMYTATAVSPLSARLRGPLLLEIGEAFTVRMSRASVAVEVLTKVVEVVRNDHGDSEMVIAFTEAERAKLAPLLP